MERRIEDLDERLRALSGALRLRGVWRTNEPVQPVPRGAPPAPRALRLRGGSGGDG